MTDQSLRLSSLDVSAYTVPTGAPEGTAPSHGTSPPWSWCRPGPAPDRHRLDLRADGVRRADPDTLATGHHGARRVRRSRRPPRQWPGRSATHGASRRGRLRHLRRRLALWDLKARLLDLPLHRLLGAVRDEVPVYGSGGFTTYDEHSWPPAHRLDRDAADSRASRSRSASLGREHRPRPATGSGKPASSSATDVELFVDANGAYTAKQAIRLMRGRAEQDVDLVRGARLLRRPGRTAPGPRRRRRRRRRWRVRHRPDLLPADVRRRRRRLPAGRRHPLRRYHRMAPRRRRRRRARPGDLRPLRARTCTLHAAAATPNLRHLEWFHDHVRIEDMFFEGTGDPRGGSVRPDDDRPGNGLIFGRRTPKHTAYSPQVRREPT